MADSYGQVQAIGGNKYTVAINAQYNQVDFEVEKPCAGLLMRIQELENIFLRVHYEDSEGKRNALISEISLKDYLCITQRLSNRVQALQVDVVTDELNEDDDPIVEQWYQFLLLFSFNGDLHLSEDNKLIVQLFQKETAEPFEEVKAYFDYYCFGEIGYPIVLDKQRILQSNDFANIDALGYDYVYIPDGVKFEYFQYNKGAYQGSRRTSFDIAKYDGALYDIRNDIAFGAKGVLVDTRTKTEFDLSHLNDADIHIYKLDCVRESTKLIQLQQRNIEQTKVRQQAAELSGAVKSTGNVRTATPSNPVPGQGMTLNDSGGTVWTPPINPNNPTIGTTGSGSKLSIHSVKGF